MEIHSTIKIEWLRDEQRLDEAVRNKLVADIVKQLQENVTKSVNSEVHKLFLEKIDLFIDQTLSDFLDREIIVTDNWGDTVERYENVSELLKDRFDNFITEHVDIRGKKIDKGCRVGSDTFTRIEYILDRRIKAVVEKTTSAIVKQVDDKVKETLKAAMQKKLSASLVDKIDIDALIKKIQRGL